MAKDKVAWGPRGDIREIPPGDTTMYVMGYVELADCRMFMRTAMIFLDPHSEHDIKTRVYDVRINHMNERHKGFSSEWGTFEQALETYQHAHLLLCAAALTGDVRSVFSEMEAFADDRGWK